MGFSCGIIGLPNVGKSTLFNALTRAGVESSNYPFCTIEPNTGIVAVPDKRLNKLQELIGVPKAISTTMKFIDIAGLVKGANKGEGLGNQFLSQIREVEAIVQVVRLFEDENVSHIGDVNPVRDIEIIQTELGLKDLETLENQKLKLERYAKGGDKKSQAHLEFVEKMAQIISQTSHGFVRYDPVNEFEKAWLDELRLLSLKPVIIAANIGEGELKNLSHHQVFHQLMDYTQPFHVEVLPVCARLEDEIHELDELEAVEYARETGLTESGLTRLIEKGYGILNLITFFTFNETECRAWTIPHNSKAPQAAGRIHTDFEQGFIRAEVVHYNDFIHLGSWHSARDKGKLKQEGKEYVVEDGDIILFRFNL